MSTPSTTPIETEQSKTPRIDAALQKGALTEGRPIDIKQCTGVANDLYTEGVKLETELATAKATIAGLEAKLKEESFRVEQYSDALSSARIELGDGMGDLPFVCDGIRKMKIDAAEERTARLKAEADAAGMREAIEQALPNYAPEDIKEMVESKEHDGSIAAEITYGDLRRMTAALSPTTGAELLSRLATLEAVAQRMSALFALDTPYPLTEVLRHLLSASQHLFREHSCDHHGYEEWLQAQDAGFVLMETIRAVVMSHEYQALQKP